MLLPKILAQYQNGTYFFKTTFLVFINEEKILIVKKRLSFLVQNYIFLYNSEIHVLVIFDFFVYGALNFEEAVAVLKNLLELKIEPQ